MMFPNDVDMYGIRRNVDAFLICYYSVSMVIPILVMCSKCFNHLSVVVISLDVSQLFLYTLLEWVIRENIFSIMKVYLHMQGAKMLRWKQNNVLVVILPPVKTWRPRQEVGFRMSCSWFVMKCKVIIGKFDDPSGLLSINLLWLSEILEVLMIRPYFKRFFGSN